jgi:hypothetical protein
MYQYIRSVKLRQFLCLVASNIGSSYNAIIKLISNVSLYTVENLLRYNHPESIPIVFNYWRPDNSNNCLGLVK